MLSVNDIDFRTVAFCGVIAAFVSMLPFGCHELTVHMRWHECVNARAAASEDIGSCDELLER